MAKKIFISALLIFWVGLTVGVTQQKAAKIDFKKLTHDFGKIKEAAGTVTYKFEFSNTGNQPLVITDVQTSCGCTSPSYTRRPVMPGENGYLSVTFDPKNRPGSFNKSILVRTNAEKSNTLLRIRGEVIARDKGVEDIYPREMGPVRLKSNHLPFVTVKNTEIKTDSLEIINTSDKIIDITFTGVPDYIELKTVPDKLAPGQEGIIHGRFDGTKVNDWGFMVNRVTVKINGQSVPHNSLAYSAKVVEDFSQWSGEKLANAPQIDFEQTSFDFGEAKQNEDIAHVFTFTNTGKSNLKIRKIRATCGCTTVEPDKTLIAPGESSSFKAIFHTGSRSGAQRKSIYVISNDPENSTVRLTIKGNVKK